jgi:hypothetical protein
MKAAIKANPRRRSRDVEEWVPLVNVAASHFLFITVALACSTHVGRGIPVIINLMETITVA